jgi:hypothetical protein
MSRAKAALASAKGNWPYLLCALIALVAIWGHRCPVGVDTPQHANLFRISVDMTVGPLEYRGLYRIDPFTPYLLAYVVAYPFALLFGAIPAIKCLLTLAALTTPIMMRRWLRTIGASSELALLGFLVAFDLQYHWGFVSHEMAIPLAFAYLAAFERQGNRPGWRAILQAALLAIALFFCHGITFGLLTLIVVVSLLRRGRRLAAWRSGLHALPAVVMALVWFHLQQRHTGNKSGHDWLDWHRLTVLFSGPFSAYPSRSWAFVSIIGMVVILVAARPRLVLRGRRIVPFGVSMFLFLSLPETMADTWLIGSRLSVFVHAFAPAVLLPRSTGWLGRAWPRVVLVWVVGVLVSLNIRLYAYNQELAGLWQLASHMEPGFDVRSALPVTEHDSQSMGPGQLSHVAAWTTAEHGGILEHDSAGYFQMPIQRGSMPVPGFYRYIVAKGDAGEIARKVTEHWRSARLVHQASSWLLFEDPPAGNGDYTVVRSMQTWGQLQRDRAVSEAPLTIAGARFDHGLGTHAESFIRVRIDKAGNAFVGAYGIDDRSGPSGKARFRIRDAAGDVLFASGEMRSHEPPRPFSVLLGGRRELILEVRSVETIAHTHADWVNLSVTPPN